MSISMNPAHLQPAQDVFSGFIVKIRALDIKKGGGRGMKRERKL